MNKEKHMITTYCNEEQFNKKKNKAQFRDADEYKTSNSEMNIKVQVSNGGNGGNGAQDAEADKQSLFFEVQMDKKKIIQNMPIQVGYIVFQYAKLRMLEFVHDCVRKYLNDEDWDSLFTDTDSFGMALSETDFDDLVKSELKEEYFKDKHNWFPRTIDCKCKSCRNDIFIEENSLYDLRTPGLFKIEKTGVAFVGLCSKSYYILSKPIEEQKKDYLKKHGALANLNNFIPMQDKDKIASKGTQQRRHTMKKDIEYLDIELAQKLSFENYKKALFEVETIQGINAGLKYENGVMNVYTQPKILLNPVYVKRIVMEDGVHTYPLNI